VITDRKMTPRQQPVAGIHCKGGPRHCRLRRAATTISAECLPNCKSARNVHCEQLAAHRLPVFPELLSAFDEHAQMLADQPPRGNQRSVGSSLASQGRFTTEAAQHVVLGDLHAIATSLLRRLCGVQVQKVFVDASAAG